MGIPRVVIVGRPNVGKSSIFNWLAGRRIAIVDPMDMTVIDMETSTNSFNAAQMVSICNTNTF